jgi:hypothetical protein
MLAFAGALPAFGLAAGAALAEGAFGLAAAAAGFEAAPVFAFAGGVVFVAFATSSLPQSFCCMLHAASPLYGEASSAAAMSRIPGKSGVSSIYCDYRRPCKSCPNGRTAKICRQNPCRAATPAQACRDAGEEARGGGSLCSQDLRSMKKCGR